MADRMEFPNTMKEFIDGFSFKDSEEVYTNGAELIPVFRVEQGFERYAKEIRTKAIDEFAEMLKEKYEEHNFDLCLRQNDYYSYSNSCMLFESYIDEIAEQMKGGAENE